MRRAVASAALTAGLLLACKDEAAPDGVTTGLEVEIAHDSSLGVTSFELSAALADGRELMHAERFAAAISLLPPGLRTDVFQAPVDPALAAQQVTVKVDGLTADMQRVASGTARGMLEAGRLVKLSVRLLLPSRCGDGVLSAGSEECDDGNTQSGDGCDAGCRRELDPCAVDPQSCMPPAARVLGVEALEEHTTASTRFEPIPGAALSIDVASANESWLVFTSGLLRSDDPAVRTVELRVMVDDQESDLLGHQTMGTGADAYAGFLTFVRVQGMGHHTIRAELRAEAGTSYVRDLRIAAAWVPPGADLHLAESPGVEALTGDVVTLNELSFTPASAGRYLVLARASQNEEPNFDTVETWVEEEGGVRHPTDEGGGTFANGRGCWQPMFTAFTSDLAGGPARFRLRGAPSVALPEPGWWDPAYGYRQAITVDPQTPIAAGVAVAVGLDHQALVAAGRARADGRDLRVVRHSDTGAEELPRVLDDDAAWNDPKTLLWFQSGQTAADPAATYYLYFGQPNAAAPPEDPGAIFAFHDTFPGTALDANKWQATSNAVNLVVNGQLLLSPGTSVGTLTSYQTGAVVEARLQLSAELPEGLSYLGFGTALAGFDGYLGFSVQAGSHIIGYGAQGTPVQIASPTDSHLYAVALSELGADFFQDGLNLGTVPAPPLPEQQRVGMSNQSRQGEARYDWLRVRLAQQPAPLLTLGTVEPFPTRTSSWHGRRLLAMRTGAWAQALISTAPALVRTTEPQRTLDRLAVPAPSAPAEELVLQSMRVAGPARIDARRSGVLLENGGVVLKTAHRINKDGSADNGYHHNAAAARVRTASAAVELENALSSPDGATVEGADSVIVVLRY